jgi:hypothetical protein
MAVIGKGTTSFKKKDVAEQKGIALGFKKVRFAHKATFGDTGINLTSLVTPTEMSTNGFTNPTANTLAKAQLNIFRNNLKLVSSLRGLLVDQLSYVVSSSTQINFIDFTAEDGEIFTGWLDEAPTTSLSVVDGRTIVASGILLAGQTDFNIGTPITINQNSASQIGAVMVFADRGLQYRKVGNVSAADGDYIEVPVAGGLGSLIRFTASGSDRFITVVSNGVVAERPDGSMMAAIERTQGQIDAMVPTLAAVAGVSTSTFQTAPNSVDLKQFGDQVISLATTQVADEARITSLENPTRVKVLAGGTCTGTLGNAYNTAIYPTVTTNLGGGYNNLTGLFTCPSGGSGYYSISAAFYVTSTVVAATDFTKIGIAKNGTVIASNLSRSVASNANGPCSTHISLNSIFLNVGETLQIQSRTGMGGTLSYSPPVDGTEFYLSISLEK